MLDECLISKPSLLDGLYDVLSHVPWGSVLMLCGAIQTCAVLLVPLLEISSLKMHVLVNVIIKRVKWVLDYSVRKGLQRREINT